MRTCLNPVFLLCLPLLLALWRIHIRGLYLRVITSRININKIYTSTKYWRRQNICLDKILASTNLRIKKIVALTKYWRQQNIGVNRILASIKYTHQHTIGVNQIIALIKYWRQHNIGLYKILSWTKYLHQQNLVVNKIVASTKCTRRKNGVTLLNPSTVNISPRLYQQPATCWLPSNLPIPKSGLTQYKCGCLKLLLCAKQSSTGI